jgi:hypothetical protein
MEVKECGHTAAAAQHLPYGNEEVQVNLKLANFLGIL